MKFNKQKLNQYIETDGRSIKAIEEAAGLHHGQLSKYKNGEYAPKPKQLIAILTALNCRLQYETVVDWYQPD